MLCRKCQKKNAWANGLCKNCHNQYYYNKKAHGMTLKEFITNKEKKTYYKKGGIKYDKFVEIYNKQQGVTKTELAKQVGVSRETLYKYIEQYNKGKQEV